MMLANESGEATSEDQTKCPPKKMNLHVTSPYDLAQQHYRSGQH